MLPQIVKSNQEYLEHLWWIMHHSDDPKNEVLALECYLDESGTDVSNPKAVIGGVLLDKPRFFKIQEEWQNLLIEKGFLPPLHMKEFGPDGKFGYMTAEQRHDLFTRAVDIINTFKIWSVSASVSKEDFNSFFSGITGKAASYLLYEICLTTLIVNVDSRVEGWKPKYNPKVAFLLDKNAPYPGAIIETLNKVQKNIGMPYNVSTIAYNYDGKIPAHQIADMIAWGIRRKISNQRFTNGFEPIDSIFSKKHLTNSFEDNVKLFKLFSKELFCVLPQFREMSEQAINKIEAEKRGDNV